MKLLNYPQQTMVAGFFMLLSCGAAQAEILLTPADFHNPHPESMTHGRRGVLFTRSDSWEPSATTIPYPDELRGASEITITVYFIPADLNAEGDVCFCATVSSDSPGDPAFDGETYCSIPQTVDSEWGDDYLGSSEIITPGFMSEGQILHLAISRDTNETPEDDYPGDVWFSAISVRNTSQGSSAGPNPDRGADLVVCPAPFGQETSIQYTLPKAADVSVGIFDVQGRLVERFLPGFQTGGLHAFNWDARGCSQGVYLIKLVVDGIPSKIKTIKIDQ